MVRDLIDTDNICWREELIRDLFLPCDAKITMSIPLCGSWPPDKLIWHYNANGSFSVKSAYNFIMDSNLSYTSSSSVSSHLFLQKVWALDVPPPPRIKLFTWRMCRGILPSYGNLAKRVPTVSMHCPICDHPEESETHALLECLLLKISRRIVPLTQLYGRPNIVQWQIVLMLSNRNSRMNRWGNL